MMPTSSRSRSHRWSTQTFDRIYGVLGHACPGEEIFDGFAPARTQGFRAAALVATLPGRRLYAQAGYRDGDAFEHLLEGGLTITFIPMSKTL